MAAALRPGISVIIPTYRGADRLPRALRSLAEQTLDPARFELVVVLNGPDDGSRAVVDAFRRSSPRITVRVVSLAEPGLARAQNAGLAAARRTYCTIVDDDDHVSRQYLSALLEHAAPRVMAVAQLADVGADGTGTPSFDTYINRGLAHYAGRTVDANVCPAAVAFNVGKAVLTETARSVQYDETLRSGTDVVYWNLLVNRSALRLRVIDTSEHAVYYRSVRSGSDSRPDTVDFDFAVTQRLEVIERLRPMIDDPEQYLHRAATATAAAQTGHMNRYLRSHPDRVDDVRRAVEERGFASFPYRSLLRGLGRHLVAAFVFLPSNDTSALVLARRLMERGDVVDVVSHDMGDLRVKDETVARVVAPYVDRHVVVAGPRPSLARWRTVRHYCTEGLRAVADAEAEKGPYASVYSRSMWPASHVLAAVHKARHPDVPWTAEFSDPLLRNIHGVDKKEPMPTRDPYVDEISAACVAAGFDAPATDNFYSWLEHVVYTLADEVVFTNSNQRDYMLDYLADPRLRDRVESRHRVEPHPVPRPELYHLVESDYRVDPDVTNIAYFGVFYATRGLTEVVDALRSLSRADRRRVRLHVFTSKPDELVDDLRRVGLSDVVVVNPFVPYLEFLNLTTRFDCLLVNDARTADTHPANPYLPSKWSDYAGSGTPVWSLVEPGSPMSRRTSTYRSELGDPAGARAVLEQLVALAADRARVAS